MQHGMAALKPEVMQPHWTVHASAAYDMPQCNMSFGYADCHGMPMPFSSCNTRLKLWHHRANRPRIEKPIHSCGSAAAAKMGCKPCKQSYHASMSMDCQSMSLIAKRGGFTRPSGSTTESFSCCRPQK